MNESSIPHRAGLWLPVLLALAPVVVHAQGSFAGVRVTGVELVVDRPPRALDLEALQRDVSRVQDVPLVRAAPTADRLATQSSSQVVAAPVARPSTSPSGPGPAPPRPPATGSPGTATNTLYANPHLLSSASLCAPLSRPGVRAAADQALIALIREQVDARMGGHSVHSNSNHQLGRECRAHAEYVRNRLTVKISIPRNRVFLQIMTNSVFGSGLDPNFWTRYDLDLTATFLLPTTANGRIVQETLSYRVSNIDEPDSRSITGKAALAASKLSGFLGGPDFVSRIREPRFGDVGKLVELDLAALHRALANAPQRNARIDIRHRGDVLVLHATQQPPASGPIVN